MFKFCQIYLKDRLVIYYVSKKYQIPSTKEELTAVLEVWIKWAAKFIAGDVNAFGGSWGAPELWLTSNWPIGGLKNGDVTEFPPVLQKLAKGEKAGCMLGCGLIWGKLLLLLFVFEKWGGKLLLLLLLFVWFAQLGAVFPCASGPKFCLGGLDCWLLSWKNKDKMMYKTVTSAFRTFFLFQLALKKEYLDCL